MPDHNVRTHKKNLVCRWSLLFGCLLAVEMAGGQTSSADLAKSLGVEFPSGSSSKIILQRDGKRYMIDAAAKSVSEMTA
jgi:hypothetical protein